MTNSKTGYFGKYGGQYVPESLMSYLNELEQEYNKLKDKKEFRSELRNFLRDYVGRPSPLFFAQKLSKKLGFSVYLKREDLNHTGSHKINNTLGQALLAKKMGKEELIAETGAGQHGVATATAAALLGMKCRIFMGELDTKRQKMNVQRMKLLGAEVVPVKSGTRVLKDAVDEAIKYLVNNPSVFYLLGSVVGPHPYPTIVRDFQSVISKEAKDQIQQKEKTLPTHLVACVGGGSNAIGIFSEFLENSHVKMIGVEPAGKGLDTKEHAATLTLGEPGILHGFRCYLLKNKDGTPADAYSLAPGLDYPGVGPEHSMLKDMKRVEYKTVTDKEALEAFKMLSETEGIIPALESGHALAYLIKEKDKFRKDDLVVVNLSGRGDKDVETVIG